MPIAFFTRTQTGALISRLNNDVIGAQQAFTDTLSSVVSNLISVTLVLVVMFVLSWQITLISLDHPAHLRAPGQAGGTQAVGDHPGVLRPQRPDEQHHDRALQRLGGPAGQAVRPADPGARRVRAEGRAGPRHRGDPGHVRPVLHRRPDPHRRPGHRRGLRLGRRPGRRRRPDRRHGGGAGRLPHPALRPPDRPVQRADRRDDRPGLLRPGLRGPRPAPDDPGRSPTPARSRRARPGSSSTTSTSATRPPRRSPWPRSSRWPCSTPPSPSRSCST